ncbi:MAG: Regulatory protein BlaR1 [Pelotomaculum sp. PtaB.Bin117]|nr:MAG: Regulatory protein BlaR1 [Pelotomaculum sp. PtaB.Bin117]OPY60927.1 MAG: Regulatory protein BlaR1 [Pelotomaculum sp. PtaU1.Bin065]
MLQSIFQTILTLSVVGDVLAGILLLLKPLTRKAFSPKWQYYIWLIVLLAMVVPVSIKLPPHTIEAPSAPPPAVIEQTNATQTTDQPPPIRHQETKILDGTPMEYRSIELAPNVSIGIIDAMALIWLFGAALFLLCGIVSYIVFWHKIRKNAFAVKDCRELEECKGAMKIRRKIGLLMMDGVTAPLLVGIFRPVIVLPHIDMLSENLSFVLRHELTHYKRKDLIYKWLAMLVKAVHWFNPLVYFVVKNMVEDCEISCDAVVTKDMDDENKDNYMKTILSLLSATGLKNQTFTTAMCPDAKQIKRRFAMIKQAKKTKKILSIISVLTAAVVTATAIFTGSALADMTKDGLEYRTQNEVYFKDGVKFSVNVLGKTLPPWVNDITGDDRNADIAINRIQTRDTKGRVETHIILELKGTRGQAKLSSGAYGLYGTSNTILYKNKRVYEASTLGGMEFHEFNNIGYPEYRNLPVASLISPNSGQKRHVSVYFAYDGEKKISFASVNFDTANENDNVPAASFDQYDYLEADNFEFIGDFEQAFLYELENPEFPRFFADFEKDYKNKKVDGISCAVSAASTDSIILKTDITLDAISSYEIYVTDDRGLEILSGAGEIEKGYPPQNIILTPREEIETSVVHLVTGDVVSDASRNTDPKYKLYSGKTYRLDIGLLDDGGNIVYRQREYVTIP